jgi:hypothetical protein
MDVRLRKRLGQNQAGTTVQVSDPEGAWLTQRGYADLVPTTTRTTVDSEGTGDVPTHTPRTTITSTKRKR